MTTIPDQSPINEYKVWARHEDGKLVLHYFYDTTTQNAINSLREAHPEWEIIFASPTGRKMR